MKSSPKNLEPYTIAEVDGFIHPVTIIATPKGVKEVHFAHVETIVRKLQHKNISYFFDSSHPAAVELKQYFQGKRKHFDVPVDIEGTPFQMMVWEALQSIPYGQTRSYKDVAIQIGHPKAYRAIGQACGANPVPIIIPCHRVLTSGGGLGGFSAGIEIKKALLDLERVYSHK